MIDAIKTRRRAWAVASVVLLVALTTVLWAGPRAKADGAGAEAAATSHGVAQINALQGEVQQSQVQRNKRVVRAFIKDVLVNHHGDRAASYFTPDMKWHGGTLGTFTGADTVGGVLSSVIQAIPDLRPAVKDIFGQGNKVVVRLVVSGTQSGPLLGIPATGRHVEWDAVDVYRLKDGKIAEEWASQDLTAILRDTGTYKAPWIP